MKTTRLRVRMGIAVGLAMVVALALAPAYAVHDLGLFELDRNATDLAGGGDDWATLYTGGGSAADFTGILPDIGADGGTQFQGGGSKDNNDITQWLWKTGEPLDKDDITDAYAAAYVNKVDTGQNNIGDLIIYFGLDRFSAAGSAQVGFWFLQDPNFGLTNIASGGGFKFSGVHTNNDILVQSNFSQGGVIDSITVYKWLNGALVQVIAAGDCLDANGNPAAGDDAACGTVNRQPTFAPWPYTPKANEGPPGTFLTGAFFEGGINITRLVPDAGCFTGFLAETRTSTPFDARLKDFVLGEFDVCSISVTKTGDTLSKIGDPVDYTITITNTGALPLYKDDITDTLLGTITLNGVNNGANTYILTNTCGVSLAPGASCTITARRTVLASDPDPLPNTVTVVYRGKADLSGTGITNTADHSVNLFQPAISVDKTGETLSKVGDDVHYTFTLCNNSSADTPALTCTATDPMIPSIFGPAVLPLGCGTVIHKTRTVLDTDPDPLDNTVTLSCSVAGFPNVLTTSDSHSVNLFQPAIDVAKTGDTLSKIGDSVDYTITLSNKSSADTPALTCTATDSVLGTVFGPAVLSLGNTVINKSYTVKQGDPDPLTNTVTLNCSVAGFTNVLEKSASHSVNLFQPSITFDKSVSANLSKVGDSVDYTLTLSNTSSSDTPDLVCTISDPTLGINKQVTLASGNSDVTTKTYTFQAGDPDPYTNTASVSCSPTGFPNVLTKSDSESVNLFQPSISFDKTADATLSKVTDVVNYTLTLNNTSSSDTPDLVCTITDAKLGVNKQVTLASGAGNTTNVAYTVQANDPDPLENTASVSCQVTGFSNVLSDSKSWSVNLFQPSVTVAKDCPDTATVGETITYSFTINNTSSSDSPNLTLASVSDSVLGDLTGAANTCATLASGASCNFTVDYTIQPSDPNPLVNVVTVHYNPVGFPNDITATDDCTVHIPVEGCTPGFWQGGAGLALWNQPNDPQWPNDATQPFYAGTLFNSFFNQVISSTLSGLTMLDIVGSGGTSDWVLKAARDLVAAYLNESAFPAQFPAASLASLATSWYNALTVYNSSGGTDTSALEAFHNLVSGWNSPPPPGFCPLP